jgi:(p)ppGpp synthase/HD superfamily hydrolase
MGSERKVSQLFNNNPQGLPKTRWWNYVQTDINKCKIRNWKERSENRADWGGPLRRRRSALDCNAIEEEEEEEEEKEEEEGKVCRVEVATWETGGGNMFVLPLT